MAEETLDRKGRPAVAVTGLGIVTSLGQGVAENWAALTAGRSGIKRITRFPTEGLRSQVAGCVDLPLSQPYSAYEMSLALARAVADEALAQSGIERAGGFPGPLFIATPPSELEWPALQSLYAAAPQVGKGDVYRALAAAARAPERATFMSLAPHVRFVAIADMLADELGTRGLPVSICTACASGVSAIQLGLEAIRRGETGAALCMGVDATVHPEGLVRFQLLSALSTHNDPPEKASRPFAKSRNGFVIAEGAAALVLESYAAAKSRGARILGFVRGCGERADLFHRTRSKPDGSAIIGAIASALDDAATLPDEIDYVNAHGTGTLENDKMECLALAAVLGERVHHVPVSSNKSMTGHTLIAAGAVESVFSLMTILTGTLPPTMNCEDQDPAIPLDVVAGVKRDAHVTTVLKNAFGFGGQNVCAVFSSSPA
ncbi:MAG: beta-ketoacyl-ACP synthase [Hyphomicrobiaceae bacterium]|nr:beta-ketoacyl-ACP synthase [Hyphomicrobiaceae bacterium]